MLNNYGTLTTTIGTLNNQSVLNNYIGGTLTNGYFLDNQGTLNNYGDLENFDILKNHVGGTLNNNSGATLTNQVNRALYNAGGTLNNNGTLKNYGTLEF